MEYTNEMVLQLLRHFETEPILWDPTHRHYKKKLLVANAWQRILHNLDWQCEVKDLKKKMYYLLAYYRKELNKSNTTVDFRSSWFAFDCMNSFLGDTFVVNTEENGVYKEATLELTNDLNSSGDRTQTDENISVIEERADCINEERMTECELYGQLLAQKLMKIEEDDRIVLMNNIDNLIFQTIMKSKGKIVAPLAYDTSSTNQSLITCTQTPPSHTQSVQVDDSLEHPVQYSEASKTDNGYLATKRQIIISTVKTKASPQLKTDVFGNGII